MKGKVLVFSEGVWLAHTARPLAVARGLREAGWEVVFASSGPFAMLPASDGFPVHPVYTMDAAAALAQVRSARIAYDRRMVEDYVEDDLALIRRIKPDFILNDFRLPVAISGRIAGVPFLNIVNAYLTHYYAPRRRAPREFPLTRIIGERLTTPLMPLVMKVATAIYARPFSAVARSHALDTYGDILDVLASPYLNLMCDLEEFAPVAGAPPHFRYIGPIIWEPNVPAPKWLGELDRSRATIYFTMGSTGFEDYYRLLKDAFGGTDFQVILTTGGTTEAGALPPNFRALSLAPGLAILDKSDLVICHGGNGTIYQALYQGVPILGIPTFHDQDFNMQRVEDLGLGAALDPWRLTAAKLREAAERLIGDETTAAAVHAFQAKVRATDAVKTAVKYIEDFLAHRAP